MRFRFRLSDLVFDWSRKRGIQDLADQTGINRHKISDLLHGVDRKLSLEEIGRICSALVKHYGVDPLSLPGALFEVVPDDFYEMFNTCDSVLFSVGKRDDPTLASEYAMTCDFILSGAVQAGLSMFDFERLLRLRGKVPSEVKGTDGEPARIHRYAAPEFVTATVFHRAGDSSWEATPDPVAIASYRDLCQKPRLAHIAIGSVKSSSYNELALAQIFGALAFERPGATRARDRASPIFFRYRDSEPEFDSFCSGRDLAGAGSSETPGIYFESERGEWECCPWTEEGDDAAFVVFSHWRGNPARLEVVLGGFSARATAALSKIFHEIVPELQPQYDEPDRSVGAFVVSMQLDTARNGGSEPREFVLHPVDALGVKRRIRRAGRVTAPSQKKRKKAAKRERRGSRGA